MVEPAAVCYNDEGAASHEQARRKLRASKEEARRRKKTCGRLIFGRVTVLGDKIKQIRKAKGLTLREVAQECGLSAGFLSQVERDGAVPSLASLRKLALALETSLYTLLAADDPTSPIISKSDRKTIRWSDRNVEWEVLSIQGPGTTLEAVMTRLEPGEEISNGPTTHGGGEGEEFSLILSGEVELYIEPDTYQLSAGDSAHFHSGIPHNYRNIGDGIAEILYVISPPL